MSDEPVRRRKPRRATVEPTRLNDTPVVGVFETAQPVKAPTRAVATPKPATQEHDTASEPVLEQVAAADDPRAWGDPVEDLGDWLKSQRPPHWE
ncbi:hypothetical protein [Paeniglutamicibacter cryotolerans]|uniref:Uncharacterized protein n=1 Tax=Paeniglutamicibacter cryotolerans TaxID=670079 RepID=A0A839QL07_9MICC|nr:hypothetical protein [Paeniglutamicibacter cryotolerans]MBB2993852.1 hypothetical protein [Paeniglutamicibacter cryotolerans]